MRYRTAATLAKTPTKERQTPSRFVDSGTYTAASSTFIDRSRLEALVAKHDAVSPPRQSSPDNASAAVHLCDLDRDRETKQSVNQCHHHVTWNRCAGAANPAVWLVDA